MIFDLREIFEEFGETVGAGIGEMAAFLGSREGWISNAGVVGDKRPVARYPDFSFAQGVDGGIRHLGKALAEVIEQRRMRL